MKTKKIKNFNVYVLAPLITILLTITKLAFFDEFKRNHVALLAFINWFIIGGTVFIYYFSILNPYKLYEKSEKRIGFILAREANLFTQAYQGKYDFSFNIMTPDLRLLYKIEPSDNKNKARLSLYGHVFKVIWEHGNEGIPRKFRITTNQGIAGWAFREATGTNPLNVKGAALGGLRVASNVDFNFTVKQQKLVKDLVLVASCPLVIDFKEIDGKPKEFIGVLNITSKTPGSQVLVKNKTMRKEFYFHLANLANVYLSLYI